MNSNLAMSGKLGTRLIKEPRASLAWKLSNFHRLWPGLWREALAKTTKAPTLFGHLYARHVRADGSVVNYGLVSTRVVTTAFVDFIVDQLIAESSIFGDYKYHDSGIGITGALIGDVDIETTDGESRATGTQAEDAHNIYESVGTITYSSTKAITEHGLFNTAASATLMDRHVFSAINVVDTDSIEFSYKLTVSDGG